MAFFLIAFIVSIFATILTWIPTLATRKLGLMSIFPQIYKTAEKNLVGQGLSIFAFAFFLYAILQSQAFQVLFSSKRKWLEKRKYFTIALVTLSAALLSSWFSWFDEFIHFYPLISPLFLTMGFDDFSSVLCLYGGSIVGLLGAISPQVMDQWFSASFGNAGKNFNYNGLAGIEFRIFTFVLFSSLIIFFNILYCNKNRNKSENKWIETTEIKSLPNFNWRKKLILMTAGFFLLTSIIAQLPKVAENFEINFLTKNIPFLSSGDYEEKSYKELGVIGGKKIAKVEVKRQNYWEKFGKWGERSINCWLVVGGIIICLLAQENIIKNLIKAIQSTIPLVLTYIISAVPATILDSSGVSENLAKLILPETANHSFEYKALFSVFFFSFLISVFITSPSLVAGLVAVFAPALFAISEPLLIYAAVFARAGTVLGLAFSPFNGILHASLEKSKITYKQFIQKTWKLFSAMSLTMSTLIILWSILKVV